MPTGGFIPKTTTLAERLAARGESVPLDRPEQPPVKTATSSLPVSITCAVKIEKGIPVPDSGRGRPAGPGLPYAQMDIGDSFFVKRKTSSGLNLKKVGAKLGFVFTARKERDGFRVWRIKP